MSIYQFFEANQYVVIFVYGLVFFLMGFGILLKNRLHSRFRLAKHLNWLAYFGILHAFADWGHLFIPIHETYASQEVYVILRMLRIILNTLSFALLFQFGLTLLFHNRSGWNKIKFLPAILFSLWFLQLITYHSFFHIPGDDLWWVRVGDIWSRYLLAFPGGALSAYAIYVQRTEFAKFGQPNFTRMLTIASFSLFAYSIAGGIVVPMGEVLFARFLNAEMFFTLTGLPVEVFRGALSLIVAVSILRIIQVFDQEYMMRLQESEKEKAIAVERNRFAQDLHDGIIQSIYATNLQLEAVKYLIKLNPSEAEEMLSASLSKRNEIISQIRQYIGELRRVTETDASLREQIEDLLEEIGIRERMNVRVEDTFEEDKVSITILYHLSLILREALTNAMKHAKANEVRIRIAGDASEVRLNIADNGEGFVLDTISTRSILGEKQGIINMQERVNALNGKFEIRSTLNKGTEIRIVLPHPGGFDDQITDR